MNVNMNYNSTLWLAVLQQEEVSSYKKGSCIIGPLILLLFSRVTELEKIIEHTENTAKVYACYIFTKNLGS